MSTPTKWGREILVNTATGADQNESRVAALANGQFVVTWTDGSLTGDETSGRAVRAQVFNVHGIASGPELLVNTMTVGDQVQPTIADLPDGRFVVGWTSSEVKAQIFESDGTEYRHEFQVNSLTFDNQWRPAITALADGGFAAAWQDQSQRDGDNSGFSVRARVFHANGAPLDQQFLVNTTTIGWQADPAIGSP